MVKNNKDNTAIKAKGGKRIKALRASFDAEKLYSVSEAIEQLKSVSKVKFDETFEIALQLGVDPRHSDQMVRGVVSMPKGTGKKVRIAVFAKAGKADEARAAGADIVGAEDLVDAIKAGKIDFDRCIATPDMMGMVGAVAKILGPKGIMPNPKLGTVTPNVAEAISLAKSGQVEFRVEKAGIIHAGFGKVSFGVQDLVENLKALVSAVVKSRPTGAKGTYLRGAYISTTMGASLKLDLSTLTA